MEAAASRVETHCLARGDVTVCRRDSIKSQTGDGETRPTTPSSLSGRLNSRGSRSEVAAAPLEFTVEQFCRETNSLLAVCEDRAPRLGLQKPQSGGNKDTAATSHELACYFIFCFFLFFLVGDVWESALAAC